MEFIERTAKTVDLAVEEFLKEFDVVRDEIEVEIVEVGSKGILGIGAKPARIKVGIIYNPEKIAINFVKDMGRAMGIDIDVKTILKENGKQLDMVLSGEHMGILIGKRGQTLDSIQYLVSLAINKGTAPYMNVLIDSENYRKRRKEILEQLALNLAKKSQSYKKTCYT
jgi:spoIIIJ-associated protein